MKPKLTDEQLLARDEAKVAARRAKIEKRKARAASKDVRRLERERAMLTALMDRGYAHDEQLGNLRDFIDGELAHARVKANEGAFQ